jgi:hypothetical protein
MVMTEPGRLSLQIGKRCVLIVDEVSGKRTSIGVQATPVRTSISSKEDVIVIVMKRQVSVYEWGRDSWLQVFTDTIEPGVRAIRWIPLTNPTFVLEYEDGTEVRFVQAGAWTRKRV